jgi:hypothetical protein
MELIPALHLVLTLRMSGAVPPHPHMPSWHAQGQLYLVCQYNEEDDQNQVQY